MNKMRALHLLFYFSFLNTLCDTDFISSELSKFGDGHYYMKTDLDLKAYIHFFYNKISFINQPRYSALIIITMYTKTNNRLLFKLTIRTSTHMNVLK